MPIVVKIIEPESKIVARGLWDEGNEELVPDGYRFSKRSCGFLSLFYFLLVVWAEWQLPCSLHLQLETGTQNFLV